MMETITNIDISEREQMMPAGQIRGLSADDWVARYGSGSLQKARRLGLVWRPLYLEERAAHEWGWEFRIEYRSRITFGDAIMEGDCAALTEAVWHIGRVTQLSRFPDSDKYETKYLILEGNDSPREEGVGVVLRETSAGWVPRGRIVCAFVALYNATGGWLGARNPL